MFDYQASLQFPQQETLPNAQDTGAELKPYAWRGTLPTHS